MNNDQKNEFLPSASKVKKWLREKKIYKLKEFIPLYVSEDLARKLWTGKKISQQHAQAFLDYIGRGNIDDIRLGASRQRSIQLSSRKIKSLLANKGLLTLKDFEIDYQLVKGNKVGTEDGTPRKVWNDQEVDRKKAKKIASYFGFDNEFSLYPDTNSPWERLVYNSEYQQEFMQFHAKDPGQLGLVIFEDCGEKTNEIIEQYKLRIKWHLTLAGKKDDCYFIILRSDDSQFEILAPIKGENCEYKNLGKRLRYPQGKGRIAFDPSPYTQLRSIPEFPLRAVSHRYNLGLVEVLSRCF